MIKQKTAWIEAAWIFGVSRLLLLLISLPVALLGTRHMQFIRAYVHILGANTTQGCSNILNCFLDIGERGDVTFIVSVAHNGYANPSYTAFFPLLPLLIHTSGALLGGSIVADCIAGAILSNACFYGALVLLYQLVRENYDAVIARKALILLAIAPYAIYFFVGYTESLSLFLILAAFFFLQRGDPRDGWLAGLCGLLATLTRSPNLALVVPFLVVFVQRFGLHGMISREDWQLKLNALLPALLVPTGLLIYMFYLWRTFGNPLMFDTAETQIWHRHTTFPWVGIIDAFRALFIPNHSVAIRNLWQIFFTLIPLAALIISWRRLPLCYSLFALAMVLFFLSVPFQSNRPNGDLSAAPRFMSLVFPIFIVFAIWSKRPRVFYLLLVISLAVCIAHTLLFVGTR